MEQKHKGLKWTFVLSAILIAALAVEMARRTDLLPLTAPTWLIVRVLGITAYLLLFFGICLGITFGMPVWGGNKVIRDRFIALHFYLNTTGVFVALLHPLLLVIDPYISFSWLQLIIPFTAPKEPLLYSLGTLTLYGLMFVVITTDLKKKMPVKVWRTFHLFAYLLFISALAHGMLGGTDTRNILIFSMYTVTFLTVLILMIIQVRMFSNLKRNALHRKETESRSVNQ